MNVAVLVGTLSSDPRTRRLPSGTDLVNYEVTTPATDGDRCSVPVVWFDPARPPALVAGDAVVVVGRIRRRFFRAGAATATRTEVEASVVARAGSKRGERALADVHRVVSPGGSVE